MRLCLSTCSHRSYAAVLPEGILEISQALAWTYRLFICLLQADLLPHPRPVPHGPRRKRCIFLERSTTRESERTPELGVVGVKSNGHPAIAFELQALWRAFADSA
jgi:hypothetical protein